MKVRSTRARSRRADFGCSAAVLTGVVVLTVVVLGALGVFALVPRSGGAAAAFIRPQPGSRPWDSTHRLNVLLLGTSGGTRRNATDTLIIASYTPATRRVSLLSLPPNLWVTIPGYGQAMISDAYADGGPRLALLTVESVTHVAIPYYAVAGHDAMRQLIDGFGGITLNSPRAAHFGAGAGSRRIGAGRQHLDGLAAVEYAHILTGPGAEASQMHRQQSVLLALANEALSPDGLFRLPGIIASLGGQISTNFPFDQVPALARALSSISASHIQLSQLDENNGAVSQYAADGARVLLPHWDRIKSLAQKELSDFSIRSAGDVEVLNGSGVVGQAALLAEWLRQAGIHVSRYASASSFSYAHTAVQVSRQAGPRARLLAGDVSTLLQAPIVLGAGAQGRVGVMVVIGRDFQDPTQQ